jgi:NACHT domain
MASERAEELVDKTDKLLLCSLKFPTMYHRQEEIKEAHQKTCSWIFCSPEIESGSGGNTRPWGNFAQWLRHGNGVYWINGKAGSGKSTLMRYISQCSITRQLLKSGAGSGTVHLAGFYFWNSGAVDQRSQVGLLRSLLFTILKDRRDLIREIFQDEWNDISHSPNTEIVWCFERLRKALLAVMRLATIQTKFFFFIDGLDEYDGDHEVIACLFKNISKSPYVKTCLSSRPWQVFEDIFSGCLTLRLQDLTFDDIRQYVKDNFEANSKFKQLSKLDPMNTSLFRMK